MIENFAETSSGLSALGLDAKALIIQLVTFVIAFWVLQRFAFKPIVRYMDKRRETIEAGVALGEQMKKEAAELEAKVEKTLAEARSKADAMLAEATESGKTVVKDAEDKAREKANGILKEADARIVSETQRARTALQSELVGLISDATEAIIGEKVDAKKDAALIEKALKEQAA